MAVHNQYYPDRNNQINTIGSQETLRADGPTIPVSVGPSPQLARALANLGLAVPPPISGLALIDTGASLCAIDEQALKQLRLAPSGYENVHTPSGTATQNTYFASLSFPGTPIPNVTFTDFLASPLAPMGILALIGRSVLSHFVLIYNGPGGQLTLAF